MTNKHIGLLINRMPKIMEKIIVLKAKIIKSASAKMTKVYQCVLFGLV